MAQIVIFDTEYTTWEGARESGWTGENQYREIVQIGALKVDWPSCTIIDSLDILVKPKRNPVLSDYFQTLTKITQEQVDLSGIAFDMALAFFMDFCGPGTPVLSFGNDSAILAENIALSHCDPHGFYGYESPNFMNAAQSFIKADPSIRDEKINSGKLWAHYGLSKPHEADEHNALFDCYSILAALKHLKDSNKIAL